MAAVADRTELARRSSLIKRVVRLLVLLPTSVAVYAAVLHTVYVDFIVTRFAYVGYRYVDPGWDVTVVAWLMATIAGACLPWRARGPSSVLLWVLYVVVVAPTILALPYMGTVDAPAGLGFGAGLALSFLVTTALVIRRREPRPLALRVSPNAFWLIVVAFSATTYVYLMVTTGVSLEFLSVVDVYDQRADYREALAESTLLGYLVSNQANVVNPLLIAWAIQRRNWPLLAVVVLGQFILYTATGFKTVLFSVLAIAVVLALFRVSRRPLLVTLVWGATGLVLVSWWLDQAVDSVIFSSLFGRRFLFTPARLSGLYFEWYSTHPLSLMGNSILRPFVDSPYEYGPARTIAIYATGSPESSLNANVFAAGFAEFGWFGVAGVAVLLGLYLRMLDRAAAGLPVWVGAVVAVMPAVTLSNTALHTAALSHGLVAAVVLVAIVPRLRAPSDVLPAAPRGISARPRASSPPPQIG